MNPVPVLPATQQPGAERRAVVPMSTLVSLLTLRSASWPSPGGRA